ncbi:hypothetical protein [Streptomyces sp. NPDC020965]|uniref:hypothetical protein n=1 Tax=Streptomyces sp. NPDC020965 TaxID=3365105 RepID=UPI003787C2B0
MILHRFRWAPGVAALSHSSPDSDGVKIRTWSTVGLPVSLSVSTVRQTTQAYGAPSDGRPPELWRRALRAVARCAGPVDSYYCPDLPPVRCGIELSVQRRALLLRWETRRHARAVGDHHAAPCPACVAACWRAPEAAT